LVVLMAFFFGWSHGPTSDPGPKNNAQDDSSTQYHADTAYVTVPVKVRVVSITQKQSTNDAKYYDSASLAEDTKARVAHERVVAPTWFAAVFALLALIFSGWTWVRFQRQSRQELRAYVDIRKANIKGVDLLNKLIFPTDGITSEVVFQPVKTTYMLKIRNHGKTPALKMQWRANVIVDDIKSPSEANLDPTKITIVDTVHNGIISERPLPPHDDEGNIAPCPMKKLNDFDIEGIRIGTRAIYVYGMISYFDVFGIRQVRTFRYMHLPENREFSNGLIPCENGNSITQNDRKWL